MSVLGAAATEARLPLSLRAFTAVSDMCARACEHAEFERAQLQQHEHRWPSRLVLLLNVFGMDCGNRAGSPSSSL